MTLTERAAKLGRQRVSEGHAILLGIDLSVPELRQEFDLGRAKGAARMAELLYEIASGEKSEGSLAACKYFLTNVVGWKEEIGPPPKWVPTVIDCMAALEREGILDDMERERKERVLRAKENHLCPECQRPWENP